MKRFHSFGQNKLVGVLRDLGDSLHRQQNTAFRIHVQIGCGRSRQLAAKEKRLSFSASKPVATALFAFAPLVRHCDWTGHQGTTPEAASPIATTTTTPTRMNARRRNLRFDASCSTARSRPAPSPIGVPVPLRVRCCLACSRGSSFFSCSSDAPRRCVRLGSMRLR